MNMKHKIINKLWIMLSVVILAACSPQEMDDYSMNNLATISADQVTFSQTVSPNSDNVITFTNTTVFPKDGVYSVRWDLGNGATGNKNIATGEYPFAGDYTVTLSIYNQDGSVATKSQVVSFPESDFNLVNKPVYVNLTGGADDLDGKTWVFDQYNNFSKEVADATGFAFSGHMGLGPINSFGQSWWGAAANDKASWKLYSYKFTFTQDGVKLKIENEGEGYGRKAVSAANGFNVTSTSGDDAIFTYPGGDYNFSIDESGVRPKLTLTGNAFMGYYCGHQEYEIVYQTDKVMALVVHNQVEQQDWAFVFCREDLNVAAPPVVKVPKTIPLFEDFQNLVPKVEFFKDAMGDLYSIFHDNPWPLPTNTSSKVALYQKKEGEFYSNISYRAKDYKFDLTKQNKVRIKVFIPSGNDYVTEFPTAGPWITNAKLLPQLAVKLQDGDHPAPWENQTEIVKTDLAKDRWIDLEFDFSGVSTRTDYDRIVIQFGAEGHAAPGVFFFDDFKFNE